MPRHIATKILNHRKWHKRNIETQELIGLDATLNDDMMTSVEDSWDQHRQTDVITPSDRPDTPSEDILAVLQRAEARRPVMHAAAEAERQVAQQAHAESVATRQQAISERWQRKHAAKHAQEQDTEGPKGKKSPPWIGPRLVYFC